MPDPADSTARPSAAELLSRLNEIVDPCSVASGLPIGLVDMGIVQDVRVEGSEAQVVLLPTFPACRFVPIFEAKIHEVLDEADLTVTVEIAAPDVVWDRSRMTPAAQRRLERRWQARRDAQATTQA